MFTQKSDHRHEFDIVTERVYINIDGNRQPRTLKLRRCTLKGCLYEEAFDLVGEGV